MKHNQTLTLQVIAESLREKYKTASEHAPCFGHQYWLEFYYELGEAVCKAESFPGRRDKRLPAFSRQLRKTFSNAEKDLFSLANFKRTKAFYLAYRDIRDDITWIAMRKLSWQHHTRYLCRIKDREERRFYLLTAVADNWTCENLCIKIKNNYYQIKGRMLSNFGTALSPELAGLAQSIFQKIYHFPFIKIIEGRIPLEREREDAIIANLPEFLKELGPGFAFLGRQHRMNGCICDLILYHTRLKCHIIIEVKIGPFKPEYVGKLITYLHSADKELKGEGDNETIGIILCESASDGIAENPLEKCRCPIGVATYRIGE